MPVSQMIRDKVASLPLSPGVYLMKDQSGKVIYVGKAKHLKNRVSSYFLDLANHTPKTRMLVSQIADFDVIMAATEFEALVLECSLIKQYMPKYNILLKDDKGYPFIRVDMEEDYPTFSLANRADEDRVNYYGPYGGRAVTQNAIDTVKKTLKLPGCAKKFPRDIRKERPCLNYQMDLCDGWCRGVPGREEYRARMEQACLILGGKYKQVAAQLHEQMEQAAEQLRFEQAADLRDRLQAIERLGQRQLVVAGALADTDVIGYAAQTRSVFTVLHFLDGSLVDKEMEVVEGQADASRSEAISSLIKQYYLRRGTAPKVIFLPCEIEDAEPFEELLLQQLGRKTRIRVPQRGDNVRLVELADKNAREELERITTREEYISKTLLLLQQMLHLPSPPLRIESYDISNTAGTEIVSSMVVFQNGQPLKRDYKRFKMRDMEGQDDYASMRQTLTRRLTHLKAGDDGFNQRPDVLLIDGGVTHAAVAESVLQELQLSIPAFGMVKDDRHRTRALVTANGAEISIQQVPAVFALIGRIQEETHRFAIEYHRKLRGKSVKRSVLDEIPGIGPKRREQLLKQFKSIRQLREATPDELQRVLPRDAAQEVYQYFHGRAETSCE